MDGSDCTVDILKADLCGYCTRSGWLYPSIKDPSVLDLELPD